MDTKAIIQHINIKGEVQNLFFFFRMIREFEDLYDCRFDVTADGYLAVIDNATNKILVADNELIFDNEVDPLRLKEVALYMSKRRRPGPFFSRKFKPRKKVPKELKKSLKIVESLESTEVKDFSI